MVDRGRRGLVKLGARGDLFQQFRDARRTIRTGTRRSVALPQAPHRDIAGRQLQCGNALLGR